MKFRYIIIDSFANVTGTNDRDLAKACFADESQVIDAEAGDEWIEPEEGDDPATAPIEEETA